MTSTALVVGLSHLASWVQAALLHGDHSSSREVRNIMHGHGDTESDNIMLLLLSL